MPPRTCLICLKRERMTGRVCLCQPQSFSESMLPMPAPRTKKTMLFQHCLCVSEKWIPLPRYRRFARANTRYKRYETSCPTSLPTMPVPVQIQKPLSCYDSHEKGGPAPRNRLHISVPSREKRDAYIEHTKDRVLLIT